MCSLSYFLVSLSAVLAAAGVECLDLVQCRSRGSPCFSSIQQDRFNCGVEYPGFDVDGKVR